MTDANKARLKALGWPKSKLPDGTPQKPRRLKPGPKPKYDAVREAHRQLITALEAIGGCSDPTCVIDPPDVPVRRPAGCSCVTRIDKIRAALRAYRGYRAKVARIVGVKMKP